MPLIPFTPSQAPQFFKSLKNKSANKISTYLYSGAPLNIEDAEGVPVLFYLCSIHSMNISRLLEKKEFTLDATKPFQVKSKTTNLLIEASMYNQIALVEYLFTHQAPGTNLDLDFRASTGRTALETAIHHGAESIVRFLVSKNASVPASGLRLAFNSNQMSIFSFLAKQPASFTETTDNSILLIDIIQQECTNAALEALPKILPHFNVNIRDAEGKTPLYHALQGNKSRFAHILIEQGADLSLSYPDKTPEDMATQLLSCLQYSKEAIKDAKAAIEKAQFRLQLEREIPVVEKVKKHKI